MIWNSLVGSFFGPILSFTTVYWYGCGRDRVRQCEIIIYNLELLGQGPGIKPFEQTKAEILSNMHYLSKNTRNEINDFLNTVVGLSHDNKKREKVVNDLKAMTKSKLFFLFGK